MKVGSKKIFCIGIIGDGCGGGREFIIEKETLFAYDPQTKKNIILLKNILGAKSITKKACILSVVCENESFKYDLSLMKKL